MNKSICKECKIYIKDFIKNYEPFGHIWIDHKFKECNKQMNGINGQRDTCVSHFAKSLFFFTRSYAKCDDHELNIDKEINND